MIIYSLSPAAMKTLWIMCMHWVSEKSVNEIQFDVEQNYKHYSSHINRLSMQCSHKGEFFLSPAAETQSQLESCVK